MFFVSLFCFKFVKNKNMDRDTAYMIAHVQMYIFHRKDVYVKAININNFRCKMLLRQAYTDAINWFRKNNVKIKIG